jgi:hypothetical protein
MQNSEADHKHIQVDYYPQFNEVVIRANKEGWKYLASVAEGLAAHGQHNSHIHLDASAGIEGNITSTVMVFYIPLEQQDK